MKWLDAADNLLARVERLFLFLALVTMVGLVAGEVILRKIRPEMLSVITGRGDELARLLMVWAGFVGASLAAKESKHLAVTIPFPIGDKGRRLLLLLRFLITTFFVGLVAVLGWQAFADKLQSPTYSAAMEYNYAYLYLAVPASFTVMALRFAMLALKGWRGDYRDPEMGHE